MKKLIKDFKAFINRGNIVDMAVGVIIGGAFGKIVTSLVNDILMPLITFMFGKADLESLSIVLKRNAEGEPTLLWAYGKFLQSVLDFLIVAVCLFIFLKIFINSQKIINDRKPSSEERKILKKKGINLFNTEAVAKELKVIREEKKQKDELEAKKNYKPNELDVLNEIKNLLQNKLITNTDLKQLENDVKEKDKE